MCCWVVALTIISYLLSDRLSNFRAGFKFERHTHDDVSVFWTSQINKKLLLLPIFLAIGSPVYFSPSKLLVTKTFSPFVNFCEVKLSETN